MTVFKTQVNMNLCRLRPPVQLILYGPIIPCLTDAIVHVIKKKDTTKFQNAW